MNVTDNEFDGYGELPYFPHFYTEYNANIIHSVLPTFVGAIIQTYMFSEDNRQCVMYVTYCSYC